MDYLTRAQFFMGFPWSSVSKESACNEEDLSLILGLGRPPEKEMATHSSILAWRILWTEEPGRLQTKGSQRVRHDLTTKHAHHMHFLKL